MVANTNLVDFVTVFVSRSAYISSIFVTLLVLKVMAVVTNIQDNNNTLYQLQNDDHSTFFFWP